MDLTNARVRLTFANGNVMDIPVNESSLAWVNPTTGRMQANGASPQGVSAILHQSVPNALVTDTTTAMQQVWFTTIPGGLLTKTAMLLVEAFAEMTGNDTKNIEIRIGPASGTFATATAIGGQSGLTTQKHVGNGAVIWNDNSTTAQKAQPAAQAQPYTSNAAATQTLAVDTSLDFNIYVGWNSAVAAGAPQNSYRLRAVAISVKQ